MEEEKGGQSHRGEACAQQEVLGEELALNEAKGVSRKVSIHGQTWKRQGKAGTHTCSCCCQILI